MQTFLYISDPKNRPRTNMRIESMKEDTQRDRMRVTVVDLVH